MLIKLQNRGRANSRVGVNGTIYSTDSDGIILVKQSDEANLVDLAGFVRIGELREDAGVTVDVVRYPETLTEFLDAARRMGLAGENLREMADFIDAERGLPVEAGEPSSEDEVRLPPAPGRIREPVANVPDPETEIDLASLSREELKKRAADMGLTIDNRWGRDRLLSEMGQNEK